MSIMIIDGANFLHRARAGFAHGEHALVFTFFRNLRALVGQMQPERVIFCREGHPKHRYAALPEYKANRIVEADSPKAREMEDFHRQCKIVIDLMSECFPISVMKHPDFECDDLIYNIIANGASSTEYVVVSNDSDFTQLPQQFGNAKVYNPMKKQYVVPPTYDYVTWKALRGDGSDNIPGIPGCGDKTATMLAENEDKLKAYFTEDPERARIFSRNHDLISFHRFNDEELMQVTCSAPSRDWDVVKTAFEGWNFQSLLVEKTWAKFIGTFDALW